MENNAPAITHLPISALDKRTTHTGLEGRSGAKETIHQFEAYSYFCQASDQFPECRINDLIKKVATQFNQSPRTVLNWYKSLRWADRYREWRSKQKEISMTMPEKKVVEMVKDLERISRSGSSILHAWMQSLDPKKLVGKEVELIATMVLKATELAMRHNGPIEADHGAGISFKANNVQLVIKE